MRYSSSCNKRKLHGTSENHLPRNYSNYSFSKYWYSN